MKQDTWQTWTCRALVGAVLFLNVQCALAFILNPGKYAPAFELQGEAGRAAVQGMGILFLMWNIPYAAAFWHPLRRWYSLNEALMMQAIGFAGECLLLTSLPVGHETLRSSITRFIIFDGVGLAAIAGAAWGVWRYRSTQDRF